MRRHSPPPLQGREWVQGGGVQGEQEWISARTGSQAHCQLSNRRFLSYLAKLLWRDHKTNSGQSPTEEERTFLVRGDRALPTPLPSSHCRTHTPQLRPSCRRAYRPRPIMRSRVSMLPRAIPNCPTQSVCSCRFFPTCTSCPLGALSLAA